MTIRDEFIEVKAERDSLKTTVSDQLRDIDRLERQRDLFAALPLELSELKRANETMGVQYANISTERAVLAAQLNARAERAEDLAARLTSAEKRNITQEGELKEAQATAQRATAELGSVARELAETKAAAQPVKVVKSTAKKAAVKKPANQELAV